MQPELFEFGALELLVLSAALGAGAAAESGRAAK